MPCHLATKTVHGLKNFTSWKNAVHGNMQTEFSAFIKGHVYEPVHKIYIDHSLVTVVSLVTVINRFRDAPAGQLLSLSS